MAFVNDLKNTLQHYVEPLRERDIFPIEKREEYIKEIFSNMQELYNINSKFLKKLQSRQKEAYVVEKIGDIFANVTNELYPYIEYGAQQIYGKVLLDEERSTNVEFAKFLKETERMPEFRKLPIDSYLAAPTTRMGRYPLLLETVLKQSASEHPDRELIPQALTDMRSILSNINSEAGKAKNIVLLKRLHKLIIGNEEDTRILKLQQEGRQVIREGNVVLKKSSDGDVYVFLFDHILLLTKKKDSFYRVCRKV
jgi:RHO1 GDP-GTP exchange protein 1/2